MNAQTANTDKELWREREGDYYADSIHVTAGGSIGINHGGVVYVAPLAKWHEAIRLADQRAELLEALRQIVTRYVELVNSGDCGSWNPEKELEVVDARAAIQRSTGEQP